MSIYYAFTLIFFYIFLTEIKGTYVRKITLSRLNILTHNHKAKAA